MERKREREEEDGREEGRKGGREERKEGEQKEGERKEGGGREGGKEMDGRVTSRSLRHRESFKLGVECPPGFGPPDLPRESLGPGL